VLAIFNLRSVLWIAFFVAILLSWAMMFMMAIDMDLDLLGRPGEMGAAMAAMDPRMPMDMPMARYGSDRCLPCGRS